MKHVSINTQTKPQAATVNTLGCFEVVSLPEFNLNGVVAKVDTGAYSGAVHCNSVELIKTKGAPSRLRFVLTDEPDVAFETESFQRRRVRSTSGQSESRYLIATSVVIQGRAYPIKIGLSDRSAMKSAMLIGRRFLRDNNMLVDVRVNEELDDEGGLL